MHVYIIRSGIYYKVGLANEPEKRLRDLQCANPTKLELCHCVKLNSRGNAQKTENKMHKMFKKHRVSGEWFEASLDDLKEGLAECVKDVEHQEVKILERKKKKRKRRITNQKPPSDEKLEVYRKILRSKDSHVRIDAKTIVPLLSSHTSITRARAEILRVKYPLRKGWKKNCFGRRIPRDIYLKNCHERYKDNA